MGLFTQTPETIQVGAQALRIISGGFLVSAVSVASSGALEGLGGCPAQEEEQRLAYAQTQLETALDAARAEAAQQRRLYRTLGLSLGGAAALLLL